MRKYYNHLKKQQDRDDRVLREAEWYLDHKTSVRDVAHNFEVSKSTVYKDFVVNLKFLNYDLYREVICLLHYNKVHACEKMNELNEQRRNRR